MLKELKLLKVGGRPVRSLSILLIDDSPIFRMALVSLLHRLGVAVVTLDRTHVECQQCKQPDVVILDVVTFHGSLRDLEESIKNYSRSTPVLMLVREDRTEQIVAGLMAGAIGFVKQTASPRELRRAITTAVSGNLFCDAKILHKILQYLPSVSPSQGVRLTKREEQVLTDVSLGRTNKEIAHFLGVTEHSIKVYVSNLLRKTGASNRGSLAMYAFMRGLRRAD